eukprot:405200-Rhodomonas_salina.2
MLVLKWAVSYYADLHTDAGTELDALRGQLMRDVTKFSQEQPAMAGVMLVSIHAGDVVIYAGDAVIFGRGADIDGRWLQSLAFSSSC